MGISHKSTGMCSNVKRSTCACCGLGSLHCFCLFKCALQWRKTGHVDIIDSYAGSFSDTWFYFSASLASVFGLFSKVKFHRDFSLPLGAQISELSAFSRGASELNLDITIGSNHQATFNITKYSVNIVNKSSQIL